MIISFLLSAAGIVQVCSAFSVPPLERIRPHQHHRQPTALSISSNEDLLPGIAVIDGANEVISDQMENLKESPYFRLFCVDILASCEYMPQELFECYSETCEVYPVDDDEVCLHSEYVARNKSKKTSSFHIPLYLQERSLRCLC